MTHDTKACQRGWLLLFEFEVGRCEIQQSLGCQLVARQQSPGCLLLLCHLRLHRHVEQLLFCPGEASEAQKLSDLTPLTPTAPDRVSSLLPRFPSCSTCLPQEPRAATRLLVVSLGRSSTAAVMYPTRIAASSLRAAVYQVDCLLYSHSRATCCEP